MRTVPDRYTIRLAGECELEQALGIMSRVMNLRMTVDEWRTLQRGQGDSHSHLAVAHEDGRMCATTAFYVRSLDLDGGRMRDSYALIGQLCGERGSAMRKQGPAISTLLWVEKHLREELQTGWMIGLVGPRIFDVYYRKLLGYSSMPMQAVEFEYFETATLVDDLCAAARRACLRFPGRLCVGFRDQMGGFSALCLYGSRIDPDPASRPEIAFSGMVWPLLRVLAAAKSMKSLRSAVLGGRLRVHGVFRHPVKSFRLICWALAVLKSSRRQSSSGSADDV